MSSVAVSRPQAPAASDPLTGEESLLWQWARQWRRPRAPARAADLDWSRLVDLAIENRMPVLADRFVRQMGLQEAIPAAAWERLQEFVVLYRDKAVTATEYLGRFAALAQARGVECMPLKGLWVSSMLYGDPTLRPGHDIDVLVRRDRVRDAIAIAEQLGFARYWPDQLPDAFYLRHHLHIELSLADCWTWLEIHWAFDHPRTRLTIDYEAVMDRARPGELLGIPVYHPAWVDLLLYLSTHLVKHAVYLPATLSRPDLARLILADGRLMYFMDVAEAIRQQAGENDWDLLVSLAHGYGAVEILGSVLRVCHDYLDAPVSEAVLAALPVAPAGRLSGRLMDETASYLVAAYQGAEPSRFWSYLVSPNWEIVFRPIRLLDLLTYWFPGEDYLRRRYGRAGLFIGLRHALNTVVEYIRLGVDLVTYTWQVRRQPLAPDVEFPPDSRCPQAAGEA